MICRSRFHCSPDLKRTAIPAAILLLICIFFIDAEKKCALFYKGDISELKDSAITVPYDIIALSKKVSVWSPISRPYYIPLTPSLFFIIDNSERMYKPQDDSTPPLDRWGERFRLAKNLIDTLYLMFDSAEVGLAIFQQYLYFDPDDNSRFMQCPDQDTGAYLSFFKIDSSYAPDGKMGYEIIKEYLETDTVIEGDYSYVDLLYKPSSRFQDSTRSNINAGFDAARHAFQVARYPGKHQVIIFLSGGEATYPRDATVNDFITDGLSNTPTTLSIFFTTGNNPPQSIRDMTLNIKASTYSVMNEKSDYWPVALYEQKLNDFLRSMWEGNRFIREAHPISLFFNGITTQNYDTTNNNFNFYNYFPLTGNTTLFEYQITYRVMYSDSTLDKDSLTNGSYTVNIKKGSSLPDYFPSDFKTQYWDRNLVFYQTSTTDSLGIKFEEVKIDTIYGYSNVLIEIMTARGNYTDRESYLPSDNGTFLCHTFPVAVDTSPVPGNGILQLHEEDSIIAVFRNPDLPLDTIRTMIPFTANSAIVPDQNSHAGTLRYQLLNNCAGEYVIQFYHVPDIAALTLYSINGKMIFKKMLMKGNIILTLPDSIAPGLYFMQLEYAGYSINEKLLFHK